MAVATGESSEKHDNVCRYGVEITVIRFIRSFCIMAALALVASAPASADAAVVVSSKLSSESAMIGEMIRLVLGAAGIPTVNRLRIGATPVVR